MIIGDDDQAVLTLIAVPVVSVPDGHGYAIRLDRWAQLRAMCYDRCRDVGHSPNESRAIVDRMVKGLRKAGGTAEGMIQAMMDDDDDARAQGCALPA